MANTVTILSYTNTFGDLLAQQNKAAVEINNISANNYTKETGTLYLSGSGTGLSVTNTAILGAGIVSSTLSLLGDTTSTANVFVNGIPWSRQGSTHDHREMVAARQRDGVRQSLVPVAAGHGPVARQYRRR